MFTLWGEIGKMRSYCQWGGASLMFSFFDSAGIRVRAHGMGGLKAQLLPSVHPLYMLNEDIILRLGLPQRATKMREAMRHHMTTITISAMLWGMIGY